MNIYKFHLKVVDINDVYLIQEDKMDTSWDLLLKSVQFMSELCQMLTASMN